MMSSPMLPCGLCSVNSSIYRKNSQPHWQLLAFTLLWAVPLGLFLQPAQKGITSPMMWGIPLSPKPRLAGDAAPCRSSQPRTTRKEKGFGHLLPALPTGKNSPFFFCCTTPEFSAFKRVLFLSFNLSLKPITNCNLEKVSC